MRKGFVLLLALAVMLSCAGGAKAQLTASDKKWILDNLPNAKKGVKMPIWGITEDGTARSVLWVDHVANSRFAVYDPEANNGGSSSSRFEDDLVLDRETGLIWPRDFSVGGSSSRTLQEAEDFCHGLVLGNRRGWRIPTVAELLTLVDPGRSSPAFPLGHPFLSTSGTNFWSSERDAFTGTNNCFVVDLKTGSVLSFSVFSNLNILAVRGGECFR